MRTTLSVRAAVPAAIAILGFCGAARAGAGQPAAATDLLLAGLIEIFSDDFESEECAPWSATSNPFGALDFDEDAFGDEEAPTAWCQLPEGFVADVTDCDDGSAAIHPGAVELCNQVDDNCVDGVDEGFDFQGDEQNCGECGNVCEQANGTNTCTSGSCVPFCSFGYQNCDGNDENGCEAARNTNPACPGGNLGSMPGDDDSEPKTASAFAEARYFVQVQDVGNCLSSDYNDIRVDLQSPPGVDFDLYLTCFDCGAGNPTIVSAIHGLGGHTDTLSLGSFENCGEDDGFFALIEVRYQNATSCGNWSLTVTGNVQAGNILCGGDTLAPGESGGR